MFERSDASRLSALPAAVRRAVASVEDFYLGHRFQVNSLALITGSAFLIRYLTLLGNPAPPGADYGNYLTNLHAAEGTDVTGGGVQYPAVFIAYLWVIESAFGEMQGLLVSGPLLAALISIPSYMLLRNYARPVLALLGAAVLTFGEWASEMIGWGGNPNLLGILFGTFFMAFLASYLRNGRRRDLVLGAVSFGLTIGSHQISAVVFAIAGVFAILIALALSRNRTLAGRGTQVMLASLACSLPFVPFYLDFAAAFPGAPLLSPTPITLTDFVFIFDWFFRESLVLWIPLAAAGLIGYRRLLRSDPVSFAIGISLIASPLMLMETLMSQHPVRPIYFLPVGIVPGAVAYIQSTMDQLGSVPETAPTPTTARTIFLVVVLTAALVLVSTAQTRMAQAEQYYYVATPSFLDVLHWIGANTPRNAIVATSGPSEYGQEASVGCEWGWWIEGYAERESLCTGNVQYLAWQSQVPRTIEANQVFAGAVSFENGWIQAGDFAPYGTRGNPLIAADFGQGYQPFVYFDDANVAASWTNLTTHSLKNATADSLALQTSLEQAEGTVSFTSTGTGSGITIMRQVSLSQQSDTVWDNYTFRAAGILNQVSVSVFGTSNSRLNDFDQPTKTLTIGSAPGFREYVGGSVRIDQGGGSLVGASFSTNPESQTPQVGFAFAPAATTFNVSFAVAAILNPSVPASPVQVYTAKQVLAQAGAGFVLVDKTRTRDYGWVSNDRADFQIAYQNSEIALFAVV